MDGVDRIIREALEIELHPYNMNKEEGFCLSKSWKALICTLKYPGKWTPSQTSWVPLHEASFSPYPCRASMAALHTQFSTENTVTSNPPLIPLTLDYLHSPPLGCSVSYKSLPTQELTASLCHLLALVHPKDGGDTILRNVGSYKSHTVSSPRR
jgi:hypothetical protein